MSQQEPQRLIHSFGRRKGRTLPPAKKALMGDVLPRVQVMLPDATSSPADFFSRPYAEYWLEIGFGSGEHLAGQAARNPHVGFIGCEPYINGFSNLLSKLKDAQHDNIRLYTDDARQLLERLHDGSFQRVFILFPDPWPKVRHHKRRLIQRPFLDLLARVMPSDGELLLATDHVDYLSWMLEQMGDCPHFEWLAEREQDWTTPPEGWIRTRYQEKAEQQGRVSTFLEYQRI